MKLRLTRYILSVPEYKILPQLLFKVKLAKHEFCFGVFSATYYSNCIDVSVVCVVPALVIAGPGHS